MVRCYSFTKTAVPGPPMNISKPKEWLKSHYHSGYSGALSNLKSYGVYRVMGWEYDLRPYLKHYLVKQWGNWYECYAPNKTLLKKATYGKIDRIVKL